MTARLPRRKGTPEMTTPLPRSVLGGQPPYSGSIPHHDEIKYYSVPPGVDGQKRATIDAMSYISCGMQRGHAGR